VLEVDHRVRNNLAGLLSLVTAMRSTTRDVNSFAGAIEGRLLAMVHVHQLLADTGWRAVDLRTLVRTLLKAVEQIAPHAIPVDVDGPPVAASPRQALPLSMILLEWFTNSGKYGAHSQPGGRLRVTWERLAGNGDGKGDRVRVRWRETGGPMVREQAPPGSLGTELVKGFATLELRGRFEPHYPPEGADYLLEFPVQEREPVPPSIGYAGGDSDAPAVTVAPVNPVVEAVTSAAMAPVAAASVEPLSVPLTERLEEPAVLPSAVRIRPARRRR
jgi:two-component sensor histidine kinase